MSEIVNFLIESFFLGFGVLMIILSLLQFGKPSSIKKLADGLADTAIVIIRIAGIVYFQYWLLAIIRSYGTEDSVLLKRLKGQYWWSFWLMFLTHPILTQLYWFKRIKKSNLFRTGIALIILMAAITFSGRLIILMIDLHRDYVHSYSIGEFISDCLIRIGVFVIIVFVTHFIRKRRKKNIA